MTLAAMIHKSNPADLLTPEKETLSMNCYAVDGNYASFVLLFKLTQKPSKSIILYNKSKEANLSIHIMNGNLNQDLTKRHLCLH